ncbi:hypothetical protein [Martelella limonii]|uniref:hypothetical protein n=1 Tax=Martelella limonii TaxID=1647649 RepID=UPI001580FEC7|nr:hypothetical protein [Martelella limonii]
MSAIKRDKADPQFGEAARLLQPSHTLFLAIFRSKRNFVHAGHKKTGSKAGFFSSMRKALSFRRRSAR